MEPLRLTMSEASKFLGINAATIRRAIKRGEINYVVVRNRYRISAESLLRWSQSRARVANKLAEKGIGQFVDKWKIRNKLFTPNPGVLGKIEGKKE